MKFVELNEAEYRKFEQKNPYGNLYQMAERAALRRRMGWYAHLLGVKEDNKIIAGCLVLSKDGMMMVPMGGVLDWENEKVIDFWLKNLLNYAKEHGAITLEVFPPIRLTVRDVRGEVLEDFNRDMVYRAFDKNGFEYEGKTTAIENKANRWVTVKDLSGFATIDEVRASYKKNVRNKLRKCTPDLDIIEVSDKNDLKDVAFAIEGSNEKNGVKSRNLSYYEDIWEIFGDQVHFMLARNKENGDAVAGRVIFDHPNETVSFISGTVQKYRRMNAMTVLQDDLLTKCFEKGIKRVNFYGMEGDFSENNHLLEFKSGFGVKVEEYIGGFKYIVDAKAYRKQEMKRLIRGAGSKIKRSILTIVKTTTSRQTKITRKVIAKDSEVKK